MPLPASQRMGTMVACGCEAESSWRRGRSLTWRPGRQWTLMAVMMSRCISGCVRAQLGRCAHLVHSMPHGGPRTSRALHDVWKHWRLHSLSV